MRTIFLCLMLISTPAAAEIVGRVSVIDGDTIEMHGKRLRLFGIDAPEGGQTCQDAAGTPYRCGQTAANALSDFIGSKTVRCDPRDVDRYGRTVAACRAGDADLAGWLVRAGLAMDYPRYSKGAYAADQTAADKADAGMWRGQFVEPWLYRACVRAGSSSQACSTGTAAR